VIQVRALSEGVTHVSELLLNEGAGVLFAVSVVVVDVLDLLSAASGSAEFDGVGETWRDDALLLGDLVSLVALGASGIAFEVEGHGGGRVATSGLLEGAGLVHGVTANVALVVHLELFVGVNAVVGGGVGGGVDLEHGEVVAETSGRSSGANGLHGLAVTEGRRVASVFRDLGNNAAVGAALLVGTFDHVDITSSVDDGNSGDGDGDEDSEDLGHCFLLKSFLLNKKKIFFCES
jgi:hypothetical protein